MQRIGLLGTDALGIHVKEVLEKNGMTVLYWGEIEKSKQGKVIDSKKFESLESLVSYASEGIIDTIIFAISSTKLKKVTEKFRGCKLVDAYIILEERKDSWELENLLLKIDLSKPRLRFLQLNLTQHCNLNCRGCANYSNLVNEPQFANYNQVIADWEQLKKFFWGVERIKLMGGEPLLNPDLANYVEACHQCFPDTKIEIGTNGILIKKMDYKLFDVMKKNNCMFVISLYKPLEGHIKEIEKYLEENKVEYRILYSKDEFFKYLSDRPISTIEQGYSFCVAKGCHSIENGEIAVCSKPLYINRINKKFNMQLPTEYGKWNIYNIEFDGWELDKRLNMPYEFCRYCVEPVYYEWSRANYQTATKGDWFV